MNILILGKTYNGLVVFKDECSYLANPLCVAVVMHIAFSWAAADRATYSTLAVDIVAQMCLLFFQLIAAPPIRTTYLEVDFLSPTPPLV